MTDTSLPDLDARPKGGFVKKLLVWLLMALLLGGGGFGAGYYFFAGDRLSPSQEVLRLIEQQDAEAEPDSAGGHKKVPRELPETTPFKTSYYEFPDPLTTNLRDSLRFLQVGIGVSTQYDATVIENVQTHSMALRSDMLAVIGSFTEEDIAGTDGRDRLAEAMKEAINARLEALEGFGGIEGVYFPTFVLQ